MELGSHITRRPRHHRLLAPGGSEVLWSTFLGGSDLDASAALALDSLGNVYVAGNTASADFPTTAPRSGPPGQRNAFAVKLDAAGKVVYSVAFGGESFDTVTGLAVNAKGEAHLAGWTTSKSFPVTPGAFQTQAGSIDGFAVKLAADGTIAYASYLSNFAPDRSSSLRINPPRMPRCAKFGSIPRAHPRRAHAGANRNCGKRDRRVREVRRGASAPTANETRIIVWCPLLWRGCVMTKLTRRNFLAFTTLAPSIVPARALGRGATAPGDRVTVGIIGSGGRAVFETSQYPSFDNVEIVAVCDAQESRRVHAKDTLEKLYSARKTGGPYRGIRMYHDFRELLAQKDIDGVYIAAPDHWHVPMLVAAMKAGKHCHTEKPLGVSVEQDLAALRAVRKYKKIFQYGAERRSTPDARKGIELVLNGRIGKVQKIYLVAPPSATGGSPVPVIEPPKGFDYNLWLGPAPEKPFCADRCLEGSGKNGIFSIYDYTLGNIGNWAAHLLDQVQWWADHSDRKSPPVKYEGSGKIAADGLFDTACQWDVRCTYEDGLLMHFVDNVTYRGIEDAPHPEMPFGRPGVTNVHNAAVFMGTEGWVMVAYEKVVTNPAALMDSVIGPNEIHLPDTALAAIPAGMPVGHQQVATAGHHQNWIKAIRNGTQPVGDIEGAARSDLVSQLAELCVRTGQSLQWDPKKETIVGNDTARKMISRSMRAPWKLT